MKTCYNNPKTTRVGYSYGKCFSNMRLLEYQKDQAMVNRLFSERQKVRDKLVKHAVISLLAWAVIMAVIWFLVIPAF